MKIQVYGSGCRRCQKLYDLLERIRVQYDVKFELEKVDDLEAIAASGLMVTPGLSVDGKMVVKGRIPPIGEILEFLGNPTQKESYSSPKRKWFKTTLTIILLLFILGSLLYAWNKKSLSPANDAGTRSEVFNGVTVYYFHGNKRCYTCNRIETLTRESLNELQKADSSNRSPVRFQSVNLDHEPNEHFIDDFDLSIRTVVVQKGNDSFLRLDEAWTLCKDTETFKKYVKDAVENFR